MQPEYQLINHCDVQSKYICRIVEQSDSVKHSLFFSFLIHVNSITLCLSNGVLSNFWITYRIIISDMQILVGQFDYEPNIDMTC